MITRKEIIIFGTIYLSFLQSIWAYMWFDGLNDWIYISLLSINIFMFTNYYLMYRKEIKKELDDKVFKQS